ncbi:MAG: HlyD family efflux transporter periplasmic adaptor subunit [Pirellulaceae bacterium]|nr:HlyD family efflux transporter periplasmic adaptor subunit [Pirellulaceae bacterium]
MKSTSTRSFSSRIRRSRIRRGNTTLLIVSALLALVAIGGIVYWTMYGGKQTAAVGPILNEVTKGPYDFMVLEQGEVEPASAIELRCEVKSRSAGGSGGSTTIIEVVPEGTFVKGPRPEAPKGDQLVKLDSRALELEFKQQQITVNTSKALLFQAENTLAVAKIAREEYLQGIFRQEKSVIENEVFVAEQALASAELALESSERLAAKGLLSPLQMKGAEFSVKKAANELNNAKGKGNVLQNFTSKKMLAQLESDIKTAESKVESEKYSLKLEEDKRDDIEKQIEKCMIYAPQDGQVVYVNKFNSGGRSGTSAEFIVEAGAQVREQQPIIKLPNSNAMQVKALINEARVTLVRPGQPVTIRVDALKDDLIEGEVTKVNQYAEPAGWGGGGVKKYAAFVTVNSPPLGLRSGMNAEVRIHIERRPDALQVPVQALAEYRGKYFVVKKNGEKFETQEVVIGSTNDKSAVIEKGLVEKDQVVMNPRNSPSLVLPDLPEPTIVREVKLDPAAKAALAEVAKSKGAPPGVGVPPGAGDPPGAVSLPGAGGPETPKGKGGPGGGGRRGGGGFTPAAMVARAFENDADKDGKLSMAEIANIDERGRQRTIDADENKDGFVDKDELTKSSEALIKQIQERGGFGGGPPGGGPGGPGGGP